MSKENKWIVRLEKFLDAHPIIKFGFRLVITLLHPFIYLAIRFEEGSVWWHMAGVAIILAAAYVYGEQVPSWLEWATWIIDSVALIFLVSWIVIKVKKFLKKS